MQKNKVNDVLAIIPARGGSKGLPGKNIKLLNGKPLIWYTIEAAREVFPDGNICVSTDDSKIYEIVKKTGLNVPFLRSPELSTDTANTWDVVRHAVEWYKNRGKVFSKVAILQPTSPLRNGNHIHEAIGLFDADTEMVVSVKETKANPYFTLLEENESGFVSRSKKSMFSRRQDCPPVYEINGAIYIIQPKILDLLSPWESSNIKKYLMSNYESIDIDDQMDFNLAKLFVDFQGENI